MSHSSGYRSIDYGRWAKRGFLFGIALFLIGTGGEYALDLTQREVPEWIHLLLIDFGFVGILVAILLPIFFGIVMPLTE